jgi:hypothetical protein
MLYDKICDPHFIKRLFPIEYNLTIRLQTESVFNNISFRWS